jgi:hypothetical protein
MRVQVIKIDETDDPYSARDKLSWVQAERVVLQLPTAAPAWRQLLALRLLQRQASQLGAHLALVTDDDEVVDVAQTLGIPIFNSVGDSYYGNWRSRRPMRRDWRPPAHARRERLQPATRLFQRPASAHPIYGWLRGLLFCAIMLSVLGLGWVLLPQATIRLQPQLTPLEVTLIVPLVQPSAVTVAADAVAVQPLKLSLRTQASQPTTGTTILNTQRAAGKVTFSNLTDSSVRIPAGSGVRSAGQGTPIQFVTQQDANLAPNVGASVTVPILAVLAGPAGNVKAGQINVVDGAQATLVAVINLQPTSGGDVQTVAAVSSRDQAILFADLRDRLQAESFSGLQNLLGPGQRLLKQSVQLNVLSRTYDHFVGEAAPQLQLELAVEVTAWAVIDNDLQQRALQALQATAAAQALPFLAQSSTWQIVAETNDALTLGASGWTGLDIKPQQIQAQVRGMSIAQAQQYLVTHLPLQKPPVIVLQPKWWAAVLPSPLQRLPWFAWQIAVESDYADSGG